MKRLVFLLILGFVLLPLQRPARAAPPGSDWPSLNADAAQSNDNAAEKTLTARNVLRLKVRWAAPETNVSYPIVASGRVYIPIISHGRVHIRAVDALTGKQVLVYPKDAQGGVIALGGSLYLAGHVLQVVDPATGEKLGQLDPTPPAKGGIWVNPIADQKVMVVGYAGTTHSTPNSLYGIDPQTKNILWKITSMSAQAAIGGGDVLTETSRGSEFYDENSGKGLTTQKSVYSDWFAGAGMAYTVASIKRGNATLYAVDQAGHRVWKRVVGPYMIATGWAHAISTTGLYLQVFKPSQSIEALDPATGAVLWSRAIQDVQRIVVANNLLFVLSSRLGQPARLIVLNATTGSPLGAIILSTGYYTFNASNGLMVADGMVFIRAVGPGNAQLLVALGL